MAEKKRIVMFPFMAQGHLNPFMALAKLLRNRGSGYAITIVNIPHNIKKLRSSLHSQANIDFAEIHLDAAAYGLPPGTENTDKLPVEFIAPFLEASEDLEAPFRDLIIDITKREGRAPVCIISDMFLAWTLKVARELGIFHSVFIAGSGYGMGVYFSISLNRDICKGKDEEFLLSDFPEASKLRSSQLGDDLKYCDLTESWFNFRARQFMFCFASDSILLNSIQELESAGAKYFSRKMGGKPVYMIGACSLGKMDDCVDRHAELFSFLDAQQPGSVLYICFGSQNSILPWQMKELAMGLEASGAAFVWVIRPASGFNATEQAWLPDGFEGRMRSKNQGYLIREFAPQVEILSHESTGAFLSHCGWNSVLESIVCGVPIIGWPLAGEQMFNSQFLEQQIGICVELARGTESAVNRDHIAEAIRTVIGKTQKGEEMRRNAREVQTKFEDATREEEGLKGSSVRARDEFLQKATFGAREELLQKHSLASKSWSVSMVGVANASHLLA